MKMPLLNPSASKKRPNLGLLLPIWAFLWIVMFCISSHAQSVKRLYLANDDHTDYMWTANETQYDSVFVKMLDYYLKEIDATKNNPPDFQSRFNCDGSFWLRTYEKYRSPRQFERLVSALRSGHMSSPLNALANTYGAQPTEAVIRGMYYPGQLERRFKIRFPLAVAMENQTLPLGLSSLWAGSGGKYSWRGTCSCASKRPDAHWTRRKHQLYNYMGLDNSGVIMKWYDMTYNNASLGGYAETRLEYKPKDPRLSLRQTIDTLSAMCNVNTANSRYPYDVAAAFGYGWDDLDTYVSDEFIAEAKRGSNAERKVRVSNEIDFFEDIEKTYPNLPTETVSYGNEWDLYCSSMNETTAKIRRSTEKLRTAEALSAIVSLSDKTFGKDLIEAKNKAYDGYGLYWEHDWTADGPVTKEERATWQIKMQKQISSYVDTLCSRAKMALGSQLRKSGNTRYYVFNPLNWERDDIADLPFEENRNIKVIDVSTGKEAVSQAIEKSGKHYLRIWAENIPSVGYKIYEIQKGNAKKLPDAATVSNSYFENDFYKIKLHPSGVISEIYDKRAGNRQLIKKTNGRYLNDLGTSDLNEGKQLEIENAGPVSVTLRAVSENPILHTVRLTLFKDSPRIDLHDSIQANFGDVKTWGFSFDLNRPSTHHEELGAVLKVKKQSNGGHYADRNARYDWQTFNHFVNVTENDGFGITLSNLDCSFFQLGQSTPVALDESSAQINALAGGQIDGETLGIQNQFGITDFSYQFALQSHQVGFDAVAAMKWSLEHQNPLVSERVTGSKGNTNPLFSLVSVDDPNVLLWALKPSEEGIDEGLIARFWNMGPESAEPSIVFSKSIKRAWETTHIETNDKEIMTVDNRLRTEFEQHQLKSFRCMVD